MNTVNLVWRNSIRKKTRFSLTLLSIVIAFFLYATYSGINHALTASVSESNQFRLMTTHKISLTRSLPLNYQQKIQQIDGVDNVSYASWFGGFFKDEKNQITVIAVDSESYFELHPEYQLAPEALTHWKKTRTGMVIGKKLAEQYGWQVGDKVPMSTSIWMDREGSFTWYLTVSGIFSAENTAVNEKQAFFQHAFFDDARAYGRDAASWFIPVISPSANSDVITKRIDTLFENAMEATRTTTEQVFIKEQTQQFADMAMILELVITAVFFTLLLIVCNAMMQVVRERRSETAMMKALGFSPLFLVGLVFFESLLLLFIGALFGCLLAVLMLGQLQLLFADFLPGIAITHTLFIDVGIIALLGALLCSLVPSFTILSSEISTELGANS